MFSWCISWVVVLTIDPSLILHLQGSAAGTSEGTGDVPRALETFRLDKRLVVENVKNFMKIHEVSLEK